MALCVTSSSVPGKTALSNQQLRMKTQRRAAVIHQMMMCEDRLKNNLWNFVLHLMQFEKEGFRRGENCDFM